MASGTFGLREIALNHLKDHELKSTLVIIDGTSISTRIAFTKCGDPRLGGDPKKTYNLIFECFRRLMQCNVIPIVIKGSRNGDNRFFIMNQRRKMSILNGLKYKKNGFKVPRFTHSIFNGFYEALADLGICCCSTDFEAKEDIMELSRKLKCPLISNDYELCLCDGVLFIPWESVEFEKEVTKSYVKCKVFDKNSLFDGISPEILPSLSVIFSKYWWYRHMFKKLLPAFKNEKKMSLRYYKILAWMKENGEYNCKYKLNEILKDSQRSPETIEILTGHFLNPKTTVIPILTENEEIKPYLENVNFNTRNFANNHQIPSEILRLVRECHLPGIFLDMYIDKAYNCKINSIEDMDEESIYAPAKKLIEGIYGLLVRNLDDKPDITIRIRKTNLKKANLQEIYDTFIVNAVNFPSGKLSSTQKQSILYKIMDLEFDDNEIKPFGDGWYIFALALKFWEKECKTRINQMHIHSVLLTAFTLNWLAKHEKDSKSDANDDRFLSLYTFVLKKVKSFVTENENEVKLDSIYHIHMYLTFQACLYHVIQIFTLLELTDKIKISDFISGSYYHSIFTELKSINSVKNWFDDCKGLESLYYFICSKLRINFSV